VEGARAVELQTAMLVLPLSPQLAGGEIYLPPGTLSGRVSEVTGSAGECGPGNRLFVAMGQGVLKYRLPPALRGLELTELSIYPSSDEPPATENVNPPEIALYDWVEDEWTTLENVTLGSEYKVAEPGRFLNPVSGTLRLRVQRNSMSGFCYKFDIALKGRLPLNEGGDR